MTADRYRVEREWNRYEGTPQRELFRILRERFIDRHVPGGRRVLDFGSGPGRFTPRMGRERAQIVAFDLSRVALKFLIEKWPQGSDSPVSPERVRGDGSRPPFGPAAFDRVALLGNTLGFAESASDAVLASAESLVAPSGRLILELAPGPGERSRYLARLPPTSVARLLRSPIRAVIPRIQREGFRTEPWRKSTAGRFRRITVEELEERWRRTGWRVREALAVAPALGPDANRIAATRKDAKAWEHLLLVEEELGRDPDRLRNAASVLISAERDRSGHTVN